MRDERRILIVDSDRAFTQNVHAALALQGYRVSETTPELMMSTMSEFQPDLVLWDIEARVSGQVSPEQAIGRWPGLIFVAMARRPDMRWNRKAIGYDPPAFLNKAEGAKGAVATVRECFATRDAIAESPAKARGVVAQVVEEAKRAKLDFLSTVSHELRTPLNAIIGFSELIMRDTRRPLSDQQCRSYVEDIHLSGRHLLDVINDILDFARAEAGKLILQEQDVNLRDAVDSVMRLSGPSIRDAGIDFTDSVPDDLPLLFCDEQKLKRMLRHLVSNAAKFTRPGGKIVIEVANNAAGLTVSVRDTGVGIAQSDVERVLEPFVQAEGTLDRRHEGAGLGLPLIKAIMEIHGGGILLQSEPGQGTTVHLRFPPRRAIPRNREEDSGAISPAA